MNLNGDEKKIQQLFREMSCEDENRAPLFARLIAAAGSGTAPSPDSSRSLAIAWAVAGIVIAALIAVSLAMRHTGTQTQDNPPGQVAVEKPSTEHAPSNSSPGTIADVPPNSIPGPIVNERRPTRGRANAKRVRTRRTDDVAVRMKALAAWQSPTASLMKTPGEELLLPRLGESLRSIKIFSADEFN